MTETTTASAKAIEYFRLQKKINELTEEKDEIKKEMIEMYSKEKFDKLETPLGTVGITVKGGATYEYETEELAEEAAARELKISHYGTEMDYIKDQVKPLKKELGELQKKAKKIIPEDAETSLRFTINR